MRNLTVSGALDVAANVAANDVASNTASDRASSRRATRRTIVLQSANQNLSICLAFIPPHINRGIDKRKQLFAEGSVM